MHRALRLSTTLALCALTGAAVLTGCDGDGPVLCNADLSSDAGRKVKVFLETSNALIITAADIDSDMLSACRRMAADLAIPSTELAPVAGTESDPGAATRAACTRVVREIDSIIQSNLVVNAKLAVVYTPSVCTVDAQAETRCVEQCQPVTVTVTELECTPGQFYGECSAVCSGTCGGSCSGTCTGGCTATCTGSCSGNCNGACVGTCSARNADGTCYGHCDGTCTGVCDADCTGTCSGSCRGSCSATCSGGCAGDCTAWVRPPQCQEVQHTTTVDECQTTCSSKARFEATCTQPSVNVTYGYQATAAQRAQLDRLVTALKNNYADILRVSALTVDTIGSAASGYTTALQGVTATAQNISLAAGACVAAAVNSAYAAVSKINVAAEVSVSISVSASAQGGVAVAP